MRVNIARSIWVVALIAILFSLVSLPQVAAASMEGTTDSCGSSPLHERSSIPTCCLTGDCPHCVLSGPTDDEFLLATRFIQSKTVPIDVPKTSACNLISPKFNKPLRGSLPQTLPPRHCPEFHCRNSLDSEDFYQG